MEPERGSPEPHRTTIARRAKRKPPKLKRKRTPRTAAHELQVEERRVQVTELRKRGHTVRAIAARLGCSLATVHSDLEAVLLRTQDESKSHMEIARALSVARLDAATVGLWPKIEKGQHEATRALVRIEERRAKLEGLDAGAKLEISGAGGGPIEVTGRTALEQKLADLRKRLDPAPVQPPIAAS